MELLGVSCERQLFYINVNTNTNWAESLPTQNWLVFAIGDEKDIDAYSTLSDVCIEKNVAYVCSAGKYCELIHDIFDETIVWKKIQNGESVDSMDDFENSPMTTWDNHFSEGFWFAITTAYDEHFIIDTIVCIDYTTKGVKQHLITLIEKINSGWLPSDEEFEEPVYDS